VKVHLTKAGTATIFCHKAYKNHCLVWRVRKCVIGASTLAMSVTRIPELNSDVANSGNHEFLFQHSTKLASPQLPGPPGRLINLQSVQYFHGYAASGI